MSSGRLKILLVGGDERNISDELQQAVDIVHHIQQGKTRVTTMVAPDAQAVIIITKFVAKSALNDARKIAGNRNLPIILAKSGNYILHELRQSKNERIKKCMDAINQAAPAVAAKKSVPVYMPATPPAETEAANTTESAPAEPVAAQSTTTAIGMSPEEVWEKYSDSIIKSIYGLLKTPGDKVSESDLVSLMHTEFSLSGTDAQYVFDELAIRGILRNPSGTKTWIRPNLDRPEETSDLTETEEATNIEKPEVVEAPKHKETYIRLVEIISGLPEGPYKQKRDIVRLAAQCPEFRTKDGKELAKAYGDLIVARAVQFGVVEKTEDGQWRINTDPRVKVELVEDPTQAKPSKKNSNPVAETTQTPQNAPTLFDKLLRREIAKANGETLAEAKADEKRGPTKLLTAEAVRKCFGATSGVPVDANWIRLIKKTKPMFLPIQWDEAACHEIARRLRTADENWQQYMAAKFEFADYEWDGLAWLFLRGLPYEKVVELYPERTEMARTCQECMKKFVFTVEEQADYERRYGEVTPPNRCPSCRKAERTGLRL